MTRPRDTVFHKTLPLGSDPTLRRRFMVIDEPLPGNMRFGLLLEILDKVAEEAALNYVNQSYPTARVVTAAIDNSVLRHAADVHRDLTFAATINHIGRSSLEIGIRVEQPGEQSHHVASCYFTMVARAGQGEKIASVALPPLTYVDAMERRRAGKAWRDGRNTAIIEPPCRSRPAAANTRCYGPCIRPRTNRDFPACSAPNSSPMPGNGPIRNRKMSRPPSSAAISSVGPLSSARSAGSAPADHCRSQSDQLLPPGTHG
jgi:acyl-CoA hydrolase